MARSRYKFIDYVNDKYKTEKKKHKERDNMFHHFDDYALFLYFGKFKKNDNKYYEQLEKDMMEYSNKQTNYRDGFKED